MITLRKLKLKEYEKNQITLTELKEVLLRWYYPNTYKTRPDIFQSDMQRKLIITKVKGNHSKLSSVVFSVNGSPPKGEAILFLDNETEEYYNGSLICIGNRRISNRIHMVKILKEVNNDERKKII